MIAMDLIMVLCYATNEEAKGKINANGEREKCKCGYENKQSREKKERNETRNMQNATPFHRSQGQKEKMFWQPSTLIISNFTK